MWKQLTVDDGGTLTLRWFTWFALLELATAIVWNVFAWRSFLFGAGPTAFLIVSVLMGTGIAYYVTRELVNKTTFELCDRRLRVRHTPLPAWKNRDVSIDAIAHIWMRPHSAPGKYPRTYDVVAQIKDGREVRLVTGRFLTAARELTVSLQRLLTRA